MTGQSNKNSLWLFLGLGIVALFSILPLAGSLAAQGNAANPWTAPAAAKEVKNPVPANAKSVAAGKELFEENCLMCHGEKGAGDGVAAQTLSVKPADFADAKLMKSETDGSLFWKMSNGRGPMPGWKGTLSDTQRWQLVDYIRTFAKSAAEEKAPR
jgi:mono/diheme cytochrome c family protein